MNCGHCGEYRSPSGAYTSPENQKHDAQLCKEEHVSGWCVSLVQVPLDPREREVLGIKVKTELAVLLERELVAQRALNDLREDVLLAAKRVQSFNEQTKVDDEAATAELAEAAWREHSIGMAWETEEAEYGEHRQFVDGWISGRKSER